MLEFAIGYAEHGYPLHERIRATIELNEELIASWPGSRDLYLPAPEPGALFRNPALGATYRRIVDESRGGSREDEIEKARLAWYEGFVAEEIDRFSASEGGLLTGADMAAWQACDRARRDVRLPRADRVQDPALGRRSRRPAAARPPRGIRPGRAFVSRVRTRRHGVRKARAGRPRRALRRLRGRAARSSSFAGVQRGSAQAWSANRRRRRAIRGVDALPTVPDVAAVAGSGEPTRGDTVHLDVVDRFGNIISATPSGGWLQSSPVIPALGWPLGTRAQMFWLEEGLRFVAPTRCAPESDAVPGARASRRRAVSRVGNPRRRSAGAVGDARHSFVTSISG